MTEQHGLFTIQTWLTLTAEQRRRLEWLVREQGGDLADTLTRIVADTPLNTVPAAEGAEGEPLPARLYLAAEQRDAIERLVAEHKLPLPAILTRLVATHLAQLEAPPAAEPMRDTPSDTEVRARRTELARLRARRDAAGATAPPWLHAYIAELEADLAPLAAGSQEGSSHKR
jgi:hypothetical protein